MSDERAAKAEIAMNSLDALLQKWNDDGLPAGDAMDILVSTLVIIAETQDDPAGAIEAFKEALDIEFARKPEDRSFAFVESN